MPRGSGWVLYAKDGIPKYCYNLFGLTRCCVTGDAQLTAGTHLPRMEFAFDGGGLGKGGTIFLDLDGTKIGEGRVEATVPMLFSADETLDLGKDTGSAVIDDYTPGDSAFTGTVNWVELDIGEDSHDHLIRPQDRLRANMARQWAARTPARGAPRLLRNTVRAPTSCTNPWPDAWPEYRLMTRRRATSPGRCRSPLAAAGQRQRGRPASTTSE